MIHYQEISNDTLTLENLQKVYDQSLEVEKSKQTLKQQKLKQILHKLKKKIERLPEDFRQLENQAKSSFEIERGKIEQKQRDISLFSLFYFLFSESKRTQTKTSVNFVSLW